MNREFITAVGVGLISIIGGLLLYRYVIFQPEVVSAAPVQTRSQAALTFEQIALADTEGKQQLLSQWQKPLLLINFWAPWCAPCRREIPALIEIQQQHAENLQLIGLSFDGADNVNKFSADYAFNYPLLLVGGQSNALNRYFGNNSGGLPYTVILNAQREIVFRHSGEISESALDEQIKTLLSPTS